MTKSKKTPPKKNDYAPSKGYDRMDRIADLMHRSIAKLLREEFKDPRVKAEFITVAFVKVSRDMAHARVYVTVLDESKTAETIKVLNAASGFFRSHLARMMSLRVVPKPQFIFDESVLRGTRILSLIERENSKILDKEEDREEIEDKKDTQDKIGSKEKQNKDISNKDDK